MSMRSRESLIRLKKFQVDEKQRQVAQLQAMLDDFQRMVDELDNQIQYEEKRAGINDITHYAYPTFAKAAIQRKENIEVSIADMKKQLERAQDELTDAIADLKKYEILQARDQDAQKKTESRREQAELDDVAMIGHGR